jgi:predicted NAD-dependent protein-ADP-ribosyltransferase YbiA (DUF1768 family)
MYQKAVTFGDNDIADKILKTNNLGQIKSLRRQVANYDEDIWSNSRQQKTYEGFVENLDNMKI